MGMTRRQFIRRTGLVAAGSFLGPGWLRNPFIQTALAETIGDRYFVVVNLDGGNDGLNTVTPIADGSSGGLRAAYESARSKGGAGGLQLLASELTATAIGNDPNTQTPLALHPGLIGLKHLYDLGSVAVIQGCGYPHYSLSHEVSRKTWQSAAASSSTGWVGRYLAANYGGSDIPAVNIRSEVAGEFVQTATSVVALRRLAQFGFPYDSFDSSDNPAKRTAFLSLYDQAAAAPQPTVGYTGAAGAATLVASESYPPLNRLYQRDRASFNQAYTDLNTGFARDIREVAKVIYGVRQGAPGVRARFFEVRNGGYDTHSNQGTSGAGSTHYKLHREVGDALEVFYSDCTDMGAAGQLVIVVWSEFSRRIKQNDNGTDHGSQGPMFVIGGSLNGGIFGNHPNINKSALGGDGNTPYSQAAGDPYRSTDFRDVYGTLLKRWLNMPAATILSIVLTLDQGNANTSWTVPNFDLGFI